MLRQKLQASRGARGSQSITGSQGGALDSIPYVGGTTAVLESGNGNAYSLIETKKNFLTTAFVELRRVQLLVGDMQRQRQELSQAVRQLTENSSTIYQPIKAPKEHNASSSHIKKRSHSTSWTETDLDSMYTIDHGHNSSHATSMDNLSLVHTDLAGAGSNSTTPLYIDTGSANSSVSIMNCSSSSKLMEYGQSTKLPNISNYLSDGGIESSGMESDDVLETSTFGNLSSGAEKTEIKTVRIVKRESERRHRDRERGSISATSTSTQNLDNVTEEEAQQMLDDYNRSKSLPRTYIETHEIYKQSDAIPKVDHNPFHSMYSSNPAIPIKYTDYYNSMAQQYPVSMSGTAGQHTPIAMPPMDNYLQRSNSNIFFTSPQTFEKQQLPHNHQQPQLSQNQMQQQQQSKNPFHAYLDTSVNTNGNATPNSNTGLRQKTESIQSLTKTIGSLSPIFQSEAARQIIIEMSGNTSEENNEKIPLASKQRRAVPREKRRHYTAPNTLNAKSMQNIQSENDMNKNVCIVIIVGIIFFFYI